MKTRLTWILSHLLAAALGIFLAHRSPMDPNLQHPASSEVFSEPRSTSPTTTSSKQPRHLAPSKLKAAWWALAETEMGRVERDMLKEQLLGDWLASDPEGLLRFLEKKNSWPELIRPFKIELTDSDLGVRHPQLFFEFCQREGFEPRIWTLGGDPKVIASIVTNLPKEARGIWPTDYSPSPDEQRLQEALAAFHAHDYQKLGESIDGMHSNVERRHLVTELAEAFYDRSFNRGSLEGILNLPEQIRDEVALKVIWNRHAREMTLPASRQERRQLVEELMKHDLPDAAVAGIAAMDDAGGTPTFDVGELHRENVQWALNLPAAEGFDLLRTTVFLDWTASQPEEALAYVGALPAGPVRDLAAAAVVTRAIPLDTDDEEDKWQRLEQTADLIANEERRQALQEKLQRAQASSGSDPFGSESDPFE